MKILNRKKGEIILRDVMVMIILFGGFMALASMFVQSLANSNAYDNVEMFTEYNNLGISGLGNNLINSNLSSSYNTMENATSSDKGVLGSFTSIYGVVQGAGTVLKEVIKAPSYVGGAMGSILESTGWVSYSVATLIKTMINLLIYTVIIFVIISALLKGGRM